MRRRADERILPSGNGARKHGYSYGQVEEALVKEPLDVILRSALRLALGDMEPATAAWTGIRVTLEDRHQGPFARDGE